MDPGSSLALLEDRLAQALREADGQGLAALAMLSLVDDAVPLPESMLSGLDERLQHLTGGRASAIALGQRRHALVFCRLQSLEEAAAMASGLIARLEASASPAEAPRLEPALGIALLRGESESPAALVKAAEDALARARAEGAPRVRFSSPEAEAHAAPSLSLEHDLRRALAAGELHLVYQPQVSLAAGAVVGFEALLRWTHPARGPISPAEFIPLAESSGLIDAIDEWVLEHACAQLAAWEEAGHYGLRMAVNVTASQLRDAGLYERVRALLKGHGLPGSQLELELTERSFTECTPQTLARIQRIRELGVSVAIDDFGTGYSNLAYLSRLPVDCVKIDLSFTQGVSRNPIDAAICRAVCELGRVLKIRVVAEGVETEEQLAFLAQLRCHEVQGYFLSRPQRAEEATGLLAAGGRLGAAVKFAPQGRHLLLVDDEENVLAALKRAFRRDGYTVHCAGNAEEGFKLLARHPIGVVLSDQRMAPMNGTEFLRRVKDLFPKTIRMVLSGYTDLQSVTNAINEGSIYKFLTKPWNDEQLREQVLAAFEQFELAGRNEDLHAQLLEKNAQLERIAREQSDRLAQELALLDVSREVLRAVPLPILGYDDNELIVVSNAAADALLGDGVPLIGASLRELTALPPLEDAERCDGCPTVELRDLPYTLHLTRVGEEGRGGGTVLALVPVIVPEMKIL